MKISELWAIHKGQTEKVSSVCRQLALGGAAICWFFKSSDVRFPLPIILSLLFFVGFFLSDVCQYYFTAIKYSRWIFNKEAELEKAGKSIEHEEVLPPPREISAISYRFYSAKVFFLFGGYACIGIELAIRAFK